MAFFMQVTLKSKKNCIFFAFSQCFQHTMLQKLSRYRRLTVKKENKLPKKKFAVNPEIISSKGIAILTLLGTILMIPSSYLFFGNSFENFSEFHYHLIDMWPHVIFSIIVPLYIHFQNKSLRRFILRQYRDSFYNMFCFELN